MPRPLLDRSNNDDRRQWRKQGVVVGAAASKTQAKRCGCWVPQPDLQAQVVMLPSGKRPGDVKAYCLFPRSQTRKGGCIMVLNDVLQLFVIIGGTVGITFQIAWAIFKEIHNNKK